MIKKWLAARTWSAWERTASGRTIRRAAAGLQEEIQFAPEAIDVLERPIDRGKADIGHLIRPFEPFHDGFADRARGDFCFPLLLEIPFDAAHEMAELLLHHRALLECGFQAHFQLFPAVRFATAIAFHDREVQNFHLFVGREAKTTATALPAAPDGETVGHEACISHPRISVVASGTLHKAVRANPSGVPAASRGSTTPPQPADQLLHLVLIVISILLDLGLSQETSGAEKRGIRSVCVFSLLQAVDNPVSLASLGYRVGPTPKRND